MDICEFPKAFELCTLDYIHTEVSTEKRSAAAASRGVWRPIVKTLSCLVGGSRGLGVVKKAHGHSRNLPNKLKCKA